ncbi:MAG: type II toxin-antitoxin system PemK/MazF family toxin [Methylotenera sp.]|nr:type II toxin-antitoxin system PemK/MazF family toxin [Methylotenera sp.]MDP2100851.1 type II toxin-antitoxin system PemK/MazF family toxin [Methylotenera sp.]MDP2403854.1 type II toxin-antitoxin system PemK/MazF family toxin [Methylotenera sp.]MDP3094995.1 type II toxin-antitoxin system PemK/MazF family toxin [Methylotenera sp.]MDP3206321.1 type II toxin-antitoxin system PemK/MazF family toxin [Methylotenera sp.]
MEISYLDTNGNCLGKASYSGFNEILIPSVTPSYNNYLILQFSNNNNYYWEVLTINIENNEVQITIEPIQNNPKSIKRIAQVNSSNPKKFLTDFSLVEVEFGFFSSILKKDAGTQRNNIYSNALLNGEIHKKRPCIVLKTFEHTAQVIPLTSKLKEKIDILIINMNNINGISNHYHKPTYALIEMIQTVSYDRVFPPRGADGKFHDKSYPISTIDKDSLKTALASLYNAGIQLKVNSLNANVIQLNKEKFRIIAASKTIISEKKQLESLILKVGKYFELGDNITTIMDELSKLN